MLSKGMPSRSGALHVATTTRKYKGRVYQTHLLRRTFRVGHQVRHETLGNISHLPASLIDIIRRALAGEEFSPATETFHVLRSLPHGHVQAVLGTRSGAGHASRTPPGSRFQTGHYTALAQQHPRRRT